MVVMRLQTIAKNVFGKESEHSSPITVTVDTTAPYLTIEEIQ